MSNVAAARTLIAETDLSAGMGHAFGADAPDGGGLPAFDPAKPQALVIGSDVVSFTLGVDADFRQAIADSALFAQLVALNKVGTNDDPMAFFDAYLTTLAGLGWVIQMRETAAVDFKGNNFDLHEALTGVISSFLAPIAGAAAAVLAVLKGLKQMNQDSPFIVLFNKRSHKARIGRFQFTYVHPDPEHGLAAEIAAFALKAEVDITQILFFRLTKKRDELRRSLGTLSIDTEALKQIKPNLAAKVKDFRLRMIADATLALPADD